MSFGTSIGELLTSIIKDEKAKDCSKCKKQHTMDCPNSSKCYSVIGKPYFELKEDD